MIKNLGWIALALFLYMGLPGCQPKTTKEKVENKMVDSSRAEQLLDQGRDCISRNNTTGLQNVVRQLWDLVPSEVAEAAKRGYQSGITR